MSKHTPDIVEEMVDKFANEFVNYIKTIEIGQYNESGVNIGFKTAYNLMRERLQESLTKSYQQGFKDGERETLRKVGEKISEEEDFLEDRD